MEMKLPWKKASEGYYISTWKPDRLYFVRLRNLAMLWLMDDFELGPQEITALKWHEVNLTNGKVHLKNVEAGREKVFRLDDDALTLMRKWRDYQARATYYRALEHVFTSMDGKPVSPRYIYLLLLGLVIHTFVPLNVLPIEKAENVLDEQ